MKQHRRRVALVDAGTSCLAPAIASKLVASDFDVVLAATAMSQDAPSANTANVRGARLCTVPPLSMHSEDRSTLLDFVRVEFQRLDVLVIVGTSDTDGADFLDLSEADLDESLGRGLKSPYFLTQAAAQWMLDERNQGDRFSGVIINVGPPRELSSSWSFASSIAAAGRGMATQLWAHRLIMAGIAVFEIRPGVMASEVVDPKLDSYNVATGNLLANRPGTPTDVGQVVARLACGELSYCTGNVIHVDGGLSLRRL